MKERVGSLMGWGFVVVSLICTDAFAHATLVESSPAANADVAQPEVITLTFNEPLVPMFSSFDLTMSDSRKMGLKVKISEDQKTLTGKPASKVPPGEYIVVWHAAAQTDGHRMDGTLSFSVNLAVIDSGLILLRWAQYGAAMTLFGASLFCIYALPRQGLAAASALAWPRKILVSSATFVTVRRSHLGGPR